MDVLAVVTVVVVGLVVGVEFAVAVFVNPIVDRLPGDAGLAARSDGARMLGRIMPFWYVGSVLLGVVWLVLAGGGGTAVVLGVGVALLVVAFGAVATGLLLVQRRVRALSACWSTVVLEHGNARTSRQANPTAAG